MQKNSRANFSPKIFKNRKNLNQTSRGGFNAPTTKVQFLSRQVQLNINKFYPHFILRNSTVDPIRYRNQMVQGREQLQRYMFCVWVSDLLSCGFRWWNSRLRLPNHWTEYFSIRFKIIYDVLPSIGPSTNYHSFAIKRYWSMGITRFDQTSKIAPDIVFEFCNHVAGIVATDDICCVEGRSSGITIDLSTKHLCQRCLVAKW